MVFNQALSAAQVGALVTARAPSFTADPISKPAAIPGQIYEQTLAGSATDPTGDTLTFSKVSGPAWLTVSPDGRISGVPAASDAGANRFIVRVSDGLLADDAVLNIVVGNPSGLIAHYQFDGSTADNLGGAAGTATGSPAYTSGFYDRAIRFDAVNDVVQLRSGLLNGVTDLTIAARVRWDGGGDWQRIFDFGNNTNQYLFFSPKAGSISRFAIKNGGSEQALNGPALASGEWAHVAITLVGNTGTLYLNGSAVATGNITIDPAAFSPAINYLGDSQYTLIRFSTERSMTSASTTAAWPNWKSLRLAVPPPAVNVPDSSYAGWVAGTSFPAGQAGALSDPDADGLDNAWEYYFGTNPLAASTSIASEPQLMNGAALGLDPNKTYLTLQARVRKQHLGATLVPEAPPACRSRGIRCRQPRLPGGHTDSRWRLRDRQVLLRRANRRLVDGHRRDPPPAPAAVSIVLACLPEPTLLPRPNSRTAPTEPGDCPRRTRGRRVMTPFRPFGTRFRRSGTCRHDLGTAVRLRGT
jgi:hypothetical protein